MNGENTIAEVNRGGSQPYRLLPYLIAFAVISIGAACWVHFGGGNTLFPPDALIIRTFGHNDKALQALNSAEIPMMTMVDTATIRQASFFHQAVGTTRYLAIIFTLYFCALVLLKRLFHTNNGAPQ